jgi:hypothetical protein
MRRIKQLLTMRFGAGASTRQIARELGVAPSTVREYLGRAAAAGLGWPLAAEVTDESLMALLFVNAGVRAGARYHAEPDWAALVSELKRSGLNQIVGRSSGRAQLPAIYHVGGDPRRLKLWLRIGAAIPTAAARRRIMRQASGWSVSSVVVHRDVKRLGKGMVTRHGMLIASEVIHDRQYPEPQSEMPYEIHLAMQDSDDFHVTFDDAIEKDMRLARKAMIAGADLRTEVSELRLAGDQRHVLPEPPHIGLGLVDAPSVGGVVPDLVNIELGTRGKCEAAGHEERGRLSRFRAMNASTSNGMAWPLCSPSMSAARRAASLDSCSSSSRRPARMTSVALP